MYFKGERGKTGVLLMMIRVRQDGEFEIRETKFKTAAH